MTPATASQPRTAPRVIALLLFYIAAFCQNAQALVKEVSFSTPCEAEMALCRSSSQAAAEATIFVWQTPVQVRLRLVADDDRDGYYNHIAISFEPLFSHRHWAYFADVFLQSPLGENQLLFTTRVIPAPPFAAQDIYHAELSLERHIHSDWYQLIVDFYEADSQTYIGSTDGTGGDFSLAWPLEASPVSIDTSVHVGIAAPVGESGYLVATGKTSLRLAIALFLLHWLRQRSGAWRAKHLEAAAGKISSNS